MALGPEGERRGGCVVINRHYLCQRCRMPPLGLSQAQSRLAAVGMEGMTLYQCGGTYYQPYGNQYVVVTVNEKMVVPSYRAKAASGVRRDGRKVQTFPKAASAHRSIKHKKSASGLT